MIELIIQLVNMSITASWLILAVLLFRMILHKVPKSLLIFIWVLLLIRCIFPYTFESIFCIIPSTQTLIKIADFFDISINFLLGKTDIEDFYKSSSPASFLPRFESLCSEKEVTHYKVAADCLFDKSNISRWISKGFLPELEILELLCDYFNVSPDYLLGRTEDKD